jgi:hypothetical protein
MLDLFLALHKNGEFGGISLQPPGWWWWLGQRVCGDEDGGSREEKKEEERSGLPSCPCISHQNYCFVHGVVFM